MFALLVFRVVRRSTGSGGAMDKNTLHAYDSDAGHFAEEWHDQTPPDDMYALLSAYFTPGATADIGCGSGRDVAWLQSQGFDATGYDASQGLLEQARARYPNLHFSQAALPELSGIASGQFRNVLCETVIMHLETVQIAPSVRRLLDILEPGGTLFLSWRVTVGTSLRDKHQRLYSSFDKAVVLEACEGHAVLLDKEDINLSSGKAVHRLIVRKAGK
jgi:2-polyprenyl-3-methyl-5-hydroxy-6-metoxy-1,4-benzoquinol methylase